MSNAKKWSAAYMIPTSSDYVNRVIGATFSPSKNSGNPMVCIESEIVTPAEVEVGGEPINIAGVKAKSYFITTILDPETKQVDEVKTEKKREEYKQLYEKLGIPTDDINWDNIDTKPLLGKLMLTQMESEKEERRKTPTSAQIEAAKKLNKKPEGDLMKNPMTGKVLVNWWPKIAEIFGQAPSDGVQVPY